MRAKFLSGKLALLIFYDLLYKQKQYTELLQHFEELKNQLGARQQTITRSIYVLIFATCYCQVIDNGIHENNSMTKLIECEFSLQNTPQSFAYAKQLNEQFQDAHITQDHLVFLSALALNQNAPNIAEHLLSMLWPTAHEAITSLRLLSALQMRKFVEVLRILRSPVLVYDNNKAPKEETISNEVVWLNRIFQTKVHFYNCGMIFFCSNFWQIREADDVFKRFCEDERLQSDYEQVKSNLKTNGYVVDKSLQTMIFEPFRSTNMTRHQKNRMYLQSEFDRKNLLS